MLTLICVLSYILILLHIVSAFGSSSIVSCIYSIHLFLCYTEPDQFFKTINTNTPKMFCCITHHLQYIWHIFQCP